MSASNDLRRNWQGGKWCRPERRLGIYLRDGLACCWCGAGIETEGVVLSLDHLKCNVKGGGNESSNLCTSCTRCNSARGDRPMAEFARAVAAYLDHGITPEQILSRVRNAARRKVQLAEAKKMLARRGTLTGALAERKGGK